jgi:hypothetical protein
MTTAQQRKQDKDIEKHRCDTLNALIGEQLVHSLGEPGDLLKVQVRLLWEHYYRVNVLIGEQAVSAKIANSYFVKADSDGNIVASTPKITRQY